MTRVKTIVATVAPSLRLLGRSVIDGESGQEIILNRTHCSKRLYGNADGADSLSLCLRRLLFSFYFLISSRLPLQADAEPKLDRS